MDTCEFKSREDIINYYYYDCIEKQNKIRNNIQNDIDDKSLEQEGCIDFYAQLLKLQEEISTKEMEEELLKFNS